MLFAEAIIIMMFKTLNGETPDYLSNKFIPRNDTTSYVEIVKWGWLFLNLAPILFENIDIRVSKTLGEFKSKLSNFSFDWTKETASLKSSTFCFHLFLFKQVASLISLD